MYTVRFHRHAPRVSRWRHRDCRGHWRSEPVAFDGPTSGLCCTRHWPSTRPHVRGLWVATFLAGWPGSVRRRPPGELDIGPYCGRTITEHGVHRVCGWTAGLFPVGRPQDAPGLPRRLPHEVVDRAGDQSCQPHRVPAVCWPHVPGIDHCGRLRGPNREPPRFRGHSTAIRGPNRVPEFRYRSAGPLDHPTGGPTCSTTALAEPVPTPGGPGEFCT